MEEDRSDDLLLGTRGADAAQKWLTDNAKKAGEWYKDASADQAGIGDDMLRLLGGGAKNIAWGAELPLVKQGLQALGAAGYYGGIVGGKAAEAIGIDPRIGGFAGTVLGDVAFGGAVSKAGQIAKTAGRVGKLRKAGYGGQVDDILTGRHAFAFGDEVPTAGVKDIVTASDRKRKALGRMESDLIALEKANALEAQRAGARKVSTRATVTSDPTDVKVYDLYSQRKAVKLEVPKELGGKLGQLTRIEGVDSKHFHHIFIKDLAADYVETARRIGAPEDVIQLDRIAKKYGFGLGNYKSAGIYSDKIPHGLAHDLLIAQGKQPTGAKLASKKLSIQGHKDIKKLHADFEQSIIDLALPLKEEVEAFQDAWEAIPSIDRLKLIQLRLQREGLRKRFKTKVKGKHPELDAATLKYSAHKQKMLNEVGDIRRGRAQHAENVSELAFDEAVEQAHRSGLSIKKTKPTQFPDNIQRHIKRSQEIGITEPSWKDGSIDYIWRPQSSTGQIDIPPQSAKGFKGLRDEFFEQIEKLPSGSVWELNPKFKDEKRRRIYARLFGKDARITRNPDPTLGWVLTVP